MSTSTLWAGSAVHYFPAGRDDEWFTVMFYLVVIEDEPLRPNECVCSLSFWLGVDGDVC